MKAKCSVTFEFYLRPPVTWQGEIEGAAVHTIMHRATIAASQTLQPRGWSSVVAVILERDGLESETAGEASDAGAIAR